MLGAIEPLFPIAISPLLEIFKLEPPPIKLKSPEAELLKPPPKKLHSPVEILQRPPTIAVKPPELVFNDPPPIKL